MSDAIKIDIKKEIALKHLAKYYNRKGKEINNDDILPMSRILPMMDEYAQAYHADQPPQKEQFSREDMFQCACEFCHILIDNENGRKHFDEWVDNYLNSKK